MTQFPYANVPNHRDPAFRRAVRSVAAKMEERDEEIRDQAEVDADLDDRDRKWREGRPHAGLSTFDDADRSPRELQAIESVAEKMGPIDELAMDEAARASFDADTPEAAAKRFAKAVKSISGQETDEDDFAAAEAEGYVEEEDELDEPEDKPTAASPDDYAAYDAAAAETFLPEPSPHAADRRRQAEREAALSFDDPEGASAGPRRSDSPPPTGQAWRDAHPG